MAANSLIKEAHIQDILKLKLCTKSMEQLFIISVYQLSKKLTKSMKLQTNLSQAFVG